MVILLIPTTITGAQHFGWDPDHGKFDKTEWNIMALVGAAYCDTANVCCFLFLYLYINFLERQFSIYLTLHSSW